MYRQYENPRALQEELTQKEAEYNELIHKHWLGDISDDYLYDKYIELQELKDRVNFAWQDEEYDSNYMAENYAEFEDIEPYDEVVCFA